MTTEVAPPFWWLPFPPLMTLVEHKANHMNTEPFICPAPRGCSIMSQNLSIEEYFQARRLQDLFEGPLSEVESVECYDPSDGEDKVSDGADDVQPAEAHLVAMTPPWSGRRGRGSRRSAAQRRKKRVAQQEARGTNDKHVAKKRRLEATKDTIVIDYSLPSDDKATKPGWIGKRVADLPQRVYTLTELVDDYNMKHFPWDGRYVPLLFLLLHTLMSALDPRTSYWTDMATS